MNSAKELLNKLLKDIPETKVGEVIDFIMYLKNKKDPELFLEKEEEEEIWNLIETDEKVSSEEVIALLEGE